MADRIITHKFRAYPTLVQVVALESQLAEAARLYNAALQERRDAWRVARVSIRFASQCLQLKEIRAAGDTGISSATVAQDVLHRVDESFRGFFRRVKSGAKAGYPRFRSAARYDSIGTRHYGDGMGLNASGLRVKGVAGLIRVKQHREIAGQPQTVAIKRAGRRWFVILVTRAEVVASVVPAQAVGLDVGLSSFVSLSDGVQVPAPKFLRRSEKALRRAQRHLARCRRNSRRRAKVKDLVRAIHTRTVAKRHDFTHKLSRAVVDEHGLIAVERLNIAGMSRCRSFSKSIYDAGWRLFLNQLAYKAAWAGRAYVEVDAAGTSQTCTCGARVPKTIADRWHDCASCGLSEPRDVVSAQVILNRGRRLQALTGPIGAVVCGGSQRPTSLDGSLLR